MNKDTFQETIRKAWSKETCCPPWAVAWSPENPAWGQCLATALVVNDFFRGDLLYCKHEDHFWNRTPSGKHLDFTLEQFPDGTKTCMDEVYTREQALDSGNQINKRYILLRKRFSRFLVDDQ